MKALVLTGIAIHSVDCYLLKHATGWLVIDDEDAQNFYPCRACHPTGASSPRSEFVENVAHLIDQGESRDAVAARIGSNRHTMARRLHRAKRHDLAVLFDRVVRS